MNGRGTKLHGCDYSTPVTGHQAKKESRRFASPLFCLHFPSKGFTLRGLDLSGPLEDDFEGVVEQGIAAATAISAFGLIGEVRVQATSEIGASR